MMAEPSARPSVDGDAMLVELLVDAILAGQRFKAGDVLAARGEMLHLAHALIASGAAVEAD